MNTTVEDHEKFIFLLSQVLTSFFLVFANHPQIFSYVRCPLSTLTLLLVLNALLHYRKSGLLGPGRQLGPLHKKEVAWALLGHQLISEK